MRYAVKCASGYQTESFAKRESAERRLDSIEAGKAIGLCQLAHEVVEVEETRPRK